MLQNEYNFVGYYSKHELLPKLKILMKTVTDGTRTDFMQFTQMLPKKIMTSALRQIERSDWPVKKINIKNTFFTTTKKQTFG